jgi:hypothetical protein
MDLKNIALNGGLKHTVNFEVLADGTLPPATEIKIRQIPVRDYDAGFGFVDDEPALVGFLCAKDKAWALTLAPDSYEDVLVKGRAVNQKGFFSFCQRRMERAEKQNASMISAMATLPADVVKLAMETGLAKQNRSASPTPLPGFAPPPGR